MKHPRTTICGITAIILAIVPAIQLMATGGKPDWNLVVIAIANGVANIFSPDAKQVEENHATNEQNIAAIAQKTGTEIRTREQVAAETAAAKSTTP